MVGFLRRLFVPIPGNEQPSVILRINLPVRTDRKRSVCRADRQIQKQFVPQGSVLVQNVQAPVFTICIHQSALIDRWRVDAPLEPTRVRAHCSHSSSSSLPYAAVIKTANKTGITRRFIALPPGQSDQTEADLVNFSLKCAEI